MDFTHDQQIEAFYKRQVIIIEGIVVMPTGTGKTFVQASIVAEDIKQQSGF